MDSDQANFPPLIRNRVREVPETAGIGPTEDGILPPEHIRIERERQGLEMIFDKAIRESKRARNSGVDNLNRAKMMEDLLSRIEARKEKGPDGTKNQKQEPKTTKRSWASVLGAAPPSGEENFDLAYVEP